MLLFENQTVNRNICELRYYCIFEYIRAQQNVQQHRHACQIINTFTMGTNLYVSLLGGLNHQWYRHDYPIRQLFIKFISKGPIKVIRSICNTSHTYTTGGSSWQKCVNVGVGLMAYVLFLLGAVYLWYGPKKILLL